jgi:selenocysteine lyase/cysteine desulfurase
VTSEARAIHALLPLCRPKEGVDEINLDYAATTPALQVTVDAVNAFIPWYASVHRGGGVRSRRSTEAYEAARASVERFVACPANTSVVFVRNTTEAANLLAVALPAGSRILCSPAEHHANLLPWRAHDVDYLPWTATLADFVEGVEETLRAAAAAGRPYSLLAVTGASNVTGEVTPIAELTRMAHEHGALIFVDAAQLAPHRRIDLTGLDVDFLAFSGHKVYAPFGTGALIVRTEAVRGGIPMLKGGGAVRLVTLDDVVWGDAPGRFEAGTPNLVGAIALGAACDALCEVGMDRIAAVESSLARRLWSRLDSLEGVHLLRLWPDAADRVGVATFVVEGVESHELGRRLAEDWAIAVRAGSFCAHPLVAHLLDIDPAHAEGLLGCIDRGEDIMIPGAVRASIGLGTTEADIASLVTAVAHISAEARGVADVRAYVAALSAAWQAQDAAPR